MAPEPVAKKQKTAAEGAMDEDVKKLLIVEPKIKAPLDAGFAPVVLAKREYRKAAQECKDTLYFALPRKNGCGRGELKVFLEDDKRYQASVILAGVMIQEMIWMKGATSLQLCGPKGICAAVKADFSKGGAYAFEAETMPKCNGEADKTFEVTIVDAIGSLPASKDTPEVCGKEANGNRLAFDLGKSDIKTVFVKDGEVLDSMETEWDVTAVDPEYHFKMIVDAMNGTIERAKKKGAGAIQAVGGSATGTVSSDNEATWCDIFPNVPADVYKEKVVDIFKRISNKVAGDVPLKVINDGEVTALAAVQKLTKENGGKLIGNVMGISMGSSEGGGYADADGNLKGWFNELCYVKLDMNPSAPTDPWSKEAHRGLSHMYLGQRGATKNAYKITEVPENYKYPHPDMCTIKHEDHAQCLKLIQKAMKDTPEKAADLYKTCGVYLGYALAQYVEHYKIEHVMILGRVSKGDGGDIMLKTASEVLNTEFPDIPKIKFHTADDHFKAVGQCIAAAALPTIKK
eukprot:TRINITY_DN467_c0_g1_i5.p1 TRINITY_DN467_c0_g1~~TRINITY_DN467_c0_g1_i5.p1  ORF type:complete len:533 (+),score=167.54 TRINITY_DN467_c0_g1_i5:55-1599(+)